MITLITRTKEFLNALKEVRNKEFPNELQSVSIASGISNSEWMNFYKASQEERDIFWDFYEQVTRVDFEELLCQCALVSPASTCLTTNKIPFQDAEVVYEYGTIF